MTQRAAPPRLVVKTLLATFGTGSVVLLLVFLLVRMNVRDRRFSFGALRPRAVPNL